MTPFIIWLNKEDLDSLVTTLVKSAGSTTNTDQIFLSGELVELAEDLIQQNNELINLLKKIELAPLNTSLELERVRTDQKCKVYQAYMDEILMHCATHNTNNKHSPDGIKLLGCNECSLRKEPKERDSEVT